MINDKRNTQISKFLSLVLRHKPEEIGLELDGNGWADVDVLIQRCNQHDVSLTVDVLKHIVDTNLKKRFAFNEDYTKIRASQGHSVDVDLALKTVNPPAVLYHGTAERFASSILEMGLTKQERQHVHLSSDAETALNVGRRHGKPLVFEVSALQMVADGHEFFLSDNGVWLTDHVPVKYLKVF